MRYYMFDPHHVQRDGGERLYDLGLIVYRLTQDNSLALPLIKRAADYGWPDAQLFLARFWLGKTDGEQPHLTDERKINFRYAAEFAMAANAQDLLMECYSKCQAGELDDIKRRNGGDACKNFDPLKNHCLLNGEACHEDFCGWYTYTDVPAYD